MIRNPRFRPFLKNSARTLDDDYEFLKNTKNPKSAKNGVFSSRRGLSGPVGLSQEGALVQISGFSGLIFCAWNRTVPRPGPEGSGSVGA